MNVRLAPSLIKKLKKLDVRLRNRFQEKIILFRKNPYEPQLNNHQLRVPYKGLRSIDITNDYRAIFREVTQGKETFAYFSLFGTHKELYGKKSN